MAFTEKEMSRLETLTNTFKTIDDTDMTEYNKVALLEAALTIIDEVRESIANKIDELHN